ncbi:hypothetical protein N7532_012001 [Penicillium argentinense]|uniref:Autophagy-related protein 2 n=1 Tax=Penicillium argentinense TaxID=1131581 RepID=A0A9W9EJJ8_9EURO|nr:uncharacterized protein N7532_012001 [Penicillium argentinense]KAJ5082958.1 hypothetical protein N7532_012001 [Penicillium argentinense]
MASYLPLFVLKRLVNYGLSKLGLFENDVLDAVDTIRGQGSTLELRDVGLKPEVSFLPLRATAAPVERGTEPELILAGYLRLPATCEILSARIHHLRAILPDDLRNTGIAVEVNGIDIRLRLLSDDTSQAKLGSTKHRSSSLPAGYGAQEEQTLPTPANLAESFLESESKEEKEELEAAISSQSQVLHQRSSFGDSEEEEEFGLGNEETSLPSFLTRLLKGLFDRLRITIKNVAVRVDMELKQDGPAKRHPEEKPDVVSGLLTVGIIDLHGSSSATAAGPNQPSMIREGKRLLSFADINLGLVSDPVVFSNYSRFTAPTSPTTTMQSKASQASSRAPSSPSLDATGSDPGLAMTRSTIFEPTLGLSRGSGVSHVMEASSLSHEGHFSDADSDPGNRVDHSLDDSQIFSAGPFQDNPEYLDSVIDSGLDDLDGEASSREYPERQHLANSVDSACHQDSSFRGSEDLAALDKYTGTASTPQINSPESHGYDSTNVSRFGIESNELLQTSHHSDKQDDSTSQPHMSRHSSQNPTSRSESGSTASGGATPSVELTESKFFSHEEAQSLYMSAMSQGGGNSFMPSMPGAWDSFGSDQRSEADDSDVPGRANISVENTMQDQEVDDAGAASTPKLTIPSESYFGQQKTWQDKRSRSQSGSTANLSTFSSPTLNKSHEVRKPLFNVDKVLIWIPDASISNPGKSGSTQPQMPMERTESDLKEFASGLRDPKMGESLPASIIPAKPPEGSSEPRASSEPDRPGQHRPADPDDRALEIQVEVFSATLNFDISTGWLVIKALQRVSTMVTGASTEDQPKKQTSMPTLDLHVRDFSIKFIEHVAGHPYPPDQAGTSLPPPYTSMEDVLLQATASGLMVRLSANDTRTSLKLAVTKFTFGFASNDVVSFNESLKMRESTRDLANSSQTDISLSFAKSADTTRVNIFTLPLHLNLNIQQLEEVLGWMGGLSTILELGSSISSTPTMKGVHDPLKKRPKGVRFATSDPPPNKDQSLSTPLKIDVRLGGIVLDVVGDTHSLQLSTTAVKLVSRFEGIGIQIDKARLRGPMPLDYTDDAPAEINFDNIRVEFLFAPKENDLDRLVTLITPSKDKYDDDDDIMLDTLLRQRRQGSVLRLAVMNMKTTVSNVSGLAPLSSLGQEIGRLSNVTKYLPEDDRPGILALVLVREFEAHVQVGGDVGDLTARLKNAEAAWISMPSLMAAQVGKLTILRNHDEELVGEAVVPSSYHSSIQSCPPVLMARFIPDEMDPTFKVKLHHLRVEYTIPSLMAFLGLGQHTTGEGLAGEMASSIANLTDQSARTTGTSSLHSPRPDSSRSSKPTKLRVVFKDSVIGLNPRSPPSKGLVVLTNAKLNGAIHGDDSSDATLDIGKASIMIIDDVANVGKMDNLHRRSPAVIQSNQAQEYIDQGYVPVSTISAAMVVVKVVNLVEDEAKSLDVELRDDLLILETCADSTQTLINILNGLQPPTPPSVATKYRTEVMPINDMLASFSGDAFTTENALPVDASVESAPHLEGIPEEDQLSDELEYVSEFYPGKQAVLGSEDMELLGRSDGNELLDSFHSQYQVSSSITELDFQDDHFAKKSAVGGTAHRWDSTHNTYGLSNDTKLQRSPLRVRVRDMHIIWNLFDGFDWQRTRDTISKAVKDVETKATERRARASRVSPANEDDEESVIGDFLFNSIYIGIPANKDPRELHREINREINDLASETGSYATTTTATATTSRQSKSISGREKKSLRLYRSKHHKMTFELRGVCADLVVFPPDSEETQSSLDVRVKDLEIYDHVPTSTWKKFATYMHEAGERESGTSMIHLEILTVKPVPELAATEIVLKATVLPIRLHVDQDALDFMSRFFEFRDETIEAATTPGDVPFLQRVEVNAVQVKLDFKPKRVDYAGLRSGRTTEFMNFFVLDNANMVLRHVIIYGVSGFDRLGNTLNDIWMPDVKRNQLPGVLAGLAPIRSLVNVGGGVKDLVVIPMREYQKDGRIVRSIQKGALSFAKTTSNELVKLGAKLAIGTQTVLQGAEDLLTSPNAASVAPEDDRDEDDETKKISLYADQPIGVVQGLRGAFSGLERDLLLARDAIVAVPGEVVESGSATAAAKAVWKRAPTVILRPAIGVSKAVGQTLLGAGNTLDPSNRRKIDDKYKRH